MMSMVSHIYIARCGIVLSFLLTLAVFNGASADEAKTQPYDWAPESGKLLATAGVSQIEGAGGGGLVPWALITGYGTRDAVGGNAHYTFVRTSSFDLHSAGAALGLYDRVEVSFARQWLDTRLVGPKVGLGKNFMIDQNIAGLKVRLFGDAVYDQDRWWPQVSVGMQYKANNRGALLSAIGARSSDGADFYIAATKLLLANNLLVNATVRATRANQFGLLGFGSDRHPGYSPQFEGSLVYLINRNLAVGGEFRTKPDNLAFAREDNAWDVFGAWFISKNVSATAGYANLGRIAGQTSQGGLYLSLQVGF
ncbi:MAG: DUF3034 family protein [Janthinobacterium lividum]